MCCSKSYVILCICVRYLPSSLRSLDYIVGDVSCQYISERLQPVDHHNAILVMASVDGSDKTADVEAGLSLGCYSLMPLIKYKILCSCINPFMPNVFCHSYQLDKSISNFRVVGWYFSFSNFKRNFCKQTVENLIRRRKCGV